MTYLYYNSSWYNSHWHSNTHHSPMCCGHSKLAIILTTPTQQSGLPVPLVAVSHRVALKVILVSIGVSRVIVSVQPRWFATLDPAVVADDRALHLLSLGQRAGRHSEGEGHPENGIYTQAHGGGCSKIWWVECLGRRKKNLGIATALYFEYSFNGWSMGWSSSRVFRRQVVGASR